MHEHAAERNANVRCADLMQISLLLQGGSSGYTPGNHICQSDHGRELCSLQGKMLHQSGSIYNAGDM